MDEWMAAIREVAEKPRRFSMDDFRIVSIIGKGVAGTVRLCQFKESGIYYAIKSVKKSDSVRSGNVQSILAERNILMQLDFPFIVKLCFAFQSKSKFYLGLEYVPGGDLYHWHQHFIDKKSLVDQVLLYIAELSLAIDYLHSFGIVYRDLKLENILVAADGHIKLTDFGLVRLLRNGSKCNSFCGTIDYLAPEVVKEAQYGMEVDWWGIGIITYELIFGNPPFHADNDNATMNKILNEDPVFPHATDPNVHNFIMLLLNKNPRQRGKFHDIEHHPFFRGLDFKKVRSKEVKPLYIPSLDDERESFNTFETHSQISSQSESAASSAMGHVEGFSLYMKDGELLSPEELENFNPC